VRLIHEYLIFFLQISICVKNFISKIKLQIYLFIQKSLEVILNNFLNKIRLPINLILDLVLNQMEHGDTFCLGVVIEIRIN